MTYLLSLYIGKVAKSRILNYNENMIVHNKQNHLNHQRLDKTYYTKIKSSKTPKKWSKRSPKGKKFSKPVML